MQDALDRLMNGRTVLVIAHRLSTIEKADLIVVMETCSKRNGNITEIGTHRDLLQQQGAYWRLFKGIHVETEAQ